MSQSVPFCALKYSACLIAMVADARVVGQVALAVEAWPAFCTNTTDLTSCRRTDA